MHPGAQEILYVLEGSLTIEFDDREQALKPGETGLIPAEVPHLARNDSNYVMAKALVIHSRADKQKPLTVVLKAPT